MQEKKLEETRLYFVDQSIIEDLETFQTHEGDTFLKTHEIYMIQGKNSESTKTIKTNVQNIFPATMPLSSMLYEAKYSNPKGVTLLTTSKVRAQEAESLGMQAVFYNNGNNDNYEANVTFEVRGVQRRKVYTSASKMHTKSQSQK